MKILVIGGMHGNEPLGLQVVEMLKQRPLANVDSVVANIHATEAGVRFIGKDLNRSFPGTGGEYEDIRAKELLEIAKRYDIVLDFHNTYCSGNDCSFVGVNSINKLFDISIYLGLNRVIVADYDCINKYAKNCISLEVSMDSTRNNPKLWFELIAGLSRTEEVKVQRNQLEKYNFVYRLTMADRTKYNIDKHNLLAFKNMPHKLVKSLGLEGPAYPIFIEDSYTPYNYGGVLKRLNNKN